MTLPRRRQASADGSPKTRKRLVSRTGAAIGLVAALLLGSAQPALAAEPFPAPTGLTAIRTGLSEVTIDWDDVVNTGGRGPVTAYEVEQSRAGNSVIVQVAGSEAVFGNLDEGGFYTFYVTALTATARSVTNYVMFTLNNPRSELWVLVNNVASTIKPGDYTVESYGRFLAAVQAGQATLNNSGATPAEQYAAKVALDSAISGLVSIAPLLAVVATVEDLTESDYSAHSWALVVSERSAANAVLGSSAALIQTQVDAAASELQGAIDALVSIVPIRDAYDEFLTWDPADYTASSWASSAAMWGYLASSFLDDATDPSQPISLKDVQDGVADFHLVKGWLVSIVELRAAYEEFLSWDPNDYTASSWADAAAWGANASRFLTEATDPTMPVVPNAPLDGLNAFQQMKAGLVPDVTELTDYLDWFGGLDLSQFSAFSAAKLSAAMTAAEQLVTSSDPITLSQVKGAADSIRDAISSLLGISSLRYQVESYKGFDGSGYTAASVAAFLGAWDAGKQMLAADETVEFTGADMNAVITEMSKRHAWLVSTEALTQSLESANTLAAKNFTEASWAALSAAVADGAALLVRAADPADPVTWEEVGRADDAIREAINGLKLVPNDPKDVGLAKARTVISVNGEPISTGATLGIGSALLFTGSGLLPGSKFRAELHSTPIVLGTAIVDAQGNATLTVVIPPNAAVGKHTLHVYSTAADGTEMDDATAIQITGPSKAGTVVALPTTGGELLLPLLGGATVLIAAGVWMITRRRMVEAGGEGSPTSGDVQPAGL